MGGGASKDDKTYDKASGNPRWAEYEANATKWRSEFDSWTTVGRERIEKSLDVREWVDQGKRERPSDSHGAHYGNICGFVAVCRCAKIFNNTAPRIGAVFSTRWTEPQELVDYINSGCTQMYADRHYGSYYSEFKKFIRDSLRQKKPVIVLLYRSLYSQHYVTVVGMREDGNQILVVDYGGLFTMESSDKPDSHYESQGSSLLHALSYNHTIFTYAYQAMAVR